MSNILAQYHLARYQKASKDSPVSMIASGVAPQTTQAPDTEAATPEAATDSTGVDTANPLLAKFRAKKAASDAYSMYGMSARTPTAE